MSPGPAPNSAAFHPTRVDSILQRNCTRCHDGMNHRGGDQHTMPRRSKWSDADTIILEQWIRAGAIVSAKPEIPFQISSLRGRVE